MSDTDNTIKIDDPSPEDKREECDKELIDSTIPGAAFGDKDIDPPLLSDTQSKVPVDKDEIQEEAQPESESKVSGDDESGYDEIKEIDPQPDTELDVKDELDMKGENKESPEQEEGVEESKEESKEERKEETKTEVKDETKDEKQQSILPPSVSPTPDTSTPKESKIEIPIGPSVNIYKPNTLTILINTKIRNHRLLRYNPSMTISGEQSNVVCFDPLVRLNRNIVDNIPKNQKMKNTHNFFVEMNSIVFLCAPSLASEICNLFELFVKQLKRV